MRYLIGNLILFFGWTASASVAGVKVRDRLPAGPSGAIEICWLGTPTVQARQIAEDIQSYLKSQIQERAGLALAFPGNCFDLAQPLAPIGIAFYDDPQTPAGVRDLIRGNVYDPDHPGHPYTFFRGKYAAAELVDVNLTSRFLEVNDQLKKQSAELSEKGRHNLLLSIALHEVLHALGLVHEQFHPDSTCKETSEAFNPLFHNVLTAYDPASVMNYCVTHHFAFETGPIGLSPLDIEGLKHLYTN